MPESFNGLGVYSLERHRLVLPRGIEAFVPWLASQASLECLAGIGHTGGLVIFSPKALQEHREMVARLQGDDLMPDQVGTAIFELARISAVMWELTIGPDRRFTLPLGARELGIVPEGPQDRVGLVAFRGAIEVWKISELRAQLQASATRWVELRRHAGLEFET